MRDVKLKYKGANGTFESEFIKMEYLPNVGEYISSLYFKQKINHRIASTLKVTKITHYYVDDMSSIDYTEIELN